MIEVRTLGTLDLIAPRRTASRAVVSQPKRLALLTYLAVARPAGLKRRDALLALFWPESDQAHGRLVLRQTVFLLRRALGKDVLISRGGEEVGVNPDVVRSDVARFDEAVAEGRLAVALELYRGDFLSGFHAPGVATEFEEWIAAERQRLRAAAATASWALATQEEQRGALEGAIYWARRAVGLNADNEDAVRDLMLVLTRLGDRAGAARVYEDHAERLRDEYAIDQPGAALQQVMAAVRAPVHIQAPSGSSPAPAFSGMAPATEHRSATLAITHAPALDAGPDAASRVPRRWLIAAGATAGMALVALFLTVVWRSPPVRIPVLAVGPMVEIQGVDSSREAAVLGDLLATNLARVSGIEVVPAVRLYEIQANLRAAGGPPPSMLDAARLAGARQLVQGSLHALSGGASRLDLRVVDLRTDAVIRAFRADGEDLFEVVDRATALVAAGFGAEGPAAPVASVTTRSVFAYRLYEEGLRTYYASDSRAALGLFRAAIEDDSGFAMAEYYAALAGFDTGDTAAPSHLRRAARLASRAPDRERLMIQYRIAERQQSPAAQSLAETLAVRYPKDPDAQYALGTIQQWRGDFGAAAAAYRRAIAMDSFSLRAVRGRCLACEAYLQLWFSYIYADSAGAAERVAREYLHHRGVRPIPLGLLAVALTREGRFAAARAVWRTSDSLTGQAGGDDLPFAGLALRAGDFATADSLLDRLLRSATPEVRAEGVWQKAISLRNQGRLQEALALPSRSDMRALVLRESGRPREAAAIFDRMAYGIGERVEGGWARNRAWFLTHVASSVAAAGDTARLATLADSVERAGALSAFGRDARLHDYVRGLLWAARGDLPRAAAAYRASIWSWSDGYTRANYELARTAIALGRPGEAIYPLQAALRGDLESSNLYITRTELHELLGTAFAAAGERDSAVVHYRVVARAWERADPAFRERRQRAIAYLAIR